MRVLVTGADGFTGKHLVSALKSLGHEVFGLEVDLLDAEAVHERVRRINPEAVAHLAGVSYAAHDDVRSIYETNLIGSHNLLSALFKHAPNIESVLLASSASIYADSSLPITESSLIQPDSDYAVSKLSMEYMASLWLSRLPIVIVRPFNYTGPGHSSKFLVPKIVDSFVKRASSINLGNTRVVREFNDVRFIVDVYSQLLSKQLNGGTYNICTGRGYSINDVLGICSRITGHQIKVNTDAHLVRLNDADQRVGCNLQLKTMVNAWQDYALEDTLAWMFRPL